MVMNEPVASGPREKEKQTNKKKTVNMKDRLKCQVCATYAYMVWIRALHIEYILPKQ